MPRVRLLLRVRWSQEPVAVTNQFTRRPVGILLPAIPANKFQWPPRRFTQQYALSRRFVEARFSSHVFQSNFNRTIHPEKA
jgi:hypothetical protein